MIDDVIPTEDLAGGAAFLDELIDQLSALRGRGTAITVENITVALLLKLPPPRDTRLALVLAIAVQRLTDLEKEEQ